MKSHVALPLIAGASLALAAKIGAPPPTQVQPVTETIHGAAITDPYRWLENQDSPATRAWIDAQEKYARSYLDALPGRDKIRAGLTALMKIDSMSAPTRRGELYFFSRRMASEDRTSLCMRQGYNGKDEVLVDPNVVSTDQTTSVQFEAVSQDGSTVAYGIRRGGEDETEIRLLEVGTRRLLPDGLPRARYFSFAFKPDKSGYYYARFTAGVGTRVYYHAMGTHAAADREIFGNGYGPMRGIGAGVSEDGRWLLITVEDGVPSKRTEIYAQDLKANGPLQTILKEDGEFIPHFAGGYLVLNTNWKAPNRRVLRIDMAHPEAQRWKVVVPEAGEAIDGVSAVGGRIFAGYLDNVSTRVKQFDIEGKYLGDVKLPGIGSSGPPAGRWQDGEAALTFTSFVEPMTSYRYQVATGARDLWFRPKVPVRAEDFEVKQVWYASKDGTKVPMFLVYRKGLKPDASTPVLMTAYGGFNISETPRFSSMAALWAQAGGVFAMPNLRGGGEFGEKWHEAGMFEKKQNVFDDFIAAGEWLVQNHYTSPAHLAIIGGSNGGLLMGAMMTQRPDLFGAIVCAAPLLDMLRFHKLLVGAWWTAEYGSPDDPKQFPYIYKYSPYQNVKKGANYPPILFATGDADTRVSPAHARKMTALMQADNGSANPILLRYDTKGGHSGIGSVDKVIDENVDEIGFMADCVGLKFR
jgi:prolyl oligopeptidase